MPSITDISINNAAAVAKSFKGYMDQAIARFREVSSGIPVAYPQISLLSQDPLKTTKRPTYRHSFIADLPITQLADGITTRLGGITYRLTILSDAAATDTQRDDAHAFFINMLSNAACKAAITRNERFY